MPSGRCPAVLSPEHLPQVCGNYRERRRWIMCRVWEMVNTGEVAEFRDAVKRAWAETKQRCSQPGRESTGPHG